MSNYVNDLWPGSPQEKASPSTGRSSRLSSRSSSSRSSSRSSRSGAHVSSRSPSRTRRNRSRSRSRRRHQRKYRRYSRSYSRSRSRSRGRRHHRARHHEASRSRRRRSLSRRRSRSRSRSRGRSYYRRAYALTRGRRYYGFGRTVYPEEHRVGRERSRTRSRSRTPLRLTEKDRMELLEIAKANAAKALGTTNLDLPASLRTVAKETSISNNTKFELSEKLTKDGTKSPSEKSSEQRSIAFSSNVNSVKPVLEKAANSTTEEISSRSPKVDKKKSPYELWLPV